MFHFKGPIPRFICAHVHTDTYHLCHPKHMPEHVQGNDSPDVACLHLVVLIPSLYSVPVFTFNTFSSDRWPATTLPRKRNLPSKDVMGGRGGLCKPHHNKPQETPATPAQCLPKISEAHLSVPAGPLPSPQLMLAPSTFPKPFANKSQWLLKQSRERLSSSHTAAA